MEIQTGVYHLGYLFTEIPFDNVVYEFHNYTPWNFVAQSANSTYKMQYPQDNVVVIPTNAQLDYVDGLWDASKYNNTSSNTWQVLTNNTPEAVPNSIINNGYVQIYLNNLASNTTITIDQIKVSEYDQSNNFIKDVFFDDFSNGSSYIFLDGTNTDSTRVQNSTNGGYSGDGARIIQGATGSAAEIFSNDWGRFFVINPNSKYQISMRIKVQNPGPNTVVSPAIIYSHCEGQVTINKSCIEASVQPYIDYSNQKNVPIFMGEYGISDWCFEKLTKVSDGTSYMEENLGGEQWIDDMLSVISQNKLNSGYWAYSGPRTDLWGLYVGDLNDYKIYINEALENAFTKYFLDQTSQFFTTSGKDIIDPSTGEPYTIKAINISNDVWNNLKNYGSPVSGVDYAIVDITENDYQTLKSLGFNSVRFCLSYDFFNDSKGFTLIDQNVTWAKKYGISLILDMHIPNGGEQTPDPNCGGMALWTDASNQTNLIALWTSIANRYKNEPTIMGYDLVNEPVPVRLPTETAQQAVDKWKDLASRISTGIRSVDSNHILFIEPAIMTCDINGTGENTPSRIFVFRNSF